MTEERLFEELTNAVVAGLPEEAHRLASEALREGIDPLAAIEQGLKPGMDVVGEGFANGELFIPDLVMSGEAMKAGIAVFEEQLTKDKQKRKVLGRVVIGTVEGDIHEIGKTLVATMLTANDFEVHDLGVDVSAQRFVDAVREFDASLVGLSALLTTTMPDQGAVIAALKEANLRDQVKVVIGGVPTSPEWAEEIEADGHADNATEAVEVFRVLAQSLRTRA